MSNGQSFTPPSALCDVCTCTDGSVSCRYVDCPDLGSCQSQIVLEGECCPTCQDCGNHADGETWKETPCQVCTCQVRNSSKKVVTKCRQLLRMVYRTGKLNCTMLCIGVSVNEVKKKKTLKD